MNNETDKTKSAEEESQLPEKNAEVIASQEEITSEKVEIEATEFAHKIDATVEQLQSDAAKKIEQANEASGLSAEQISAVWKRLHMKERLQTIAKEASRSGEEYKHKLYEFLARATGSEGYRYEAGRMRYGILSRKIAELAGSDLNAAVRLFEEEDGKDDSFSIRFLQGSRLEDSLKNKVRERLRSLEDRGVEAMMNFMGGLTPGKFRRVAAGYVAAECVSLVRDNKATTEDVRQVVDRYPEVVYRIWNQTWDSAARTLYPETMTAELFTRAIDTNDSEAIGHYVQKLLYGNWHDADFEQSVELQQLVLHYLLEKKMYAEIADNYYRLSNPIHQLPNTTKQDITLFLQENFPDKLYHLKDEVVLSKYQKLAIIDTWKNKTNYDRLLDPESIKALNIDQSVQEEAKEQYIANYPTELLEGTPRSYGVELTSEQKRRTLENILAVEKTNDYRFIYTYCPLLLKADSIDFLEIDPETLQHLLAVYEKAHEAADPNRFFDYYNRQGYYDTLNEDQRKLFALLALQKVECHPIIQALLKKQGYEEPNKVIGILASLQSDEVIPQLKQEFAYDSAVRVIHSRKEEAKDLAILAQEPPHLLENPELMEFIIDHQNSAEALTALCSARKALAELPPEQLNRTLIGAIMSYPNQVETALRVIREVPELADIKYALRVFCASPEHADRLVTIIKDHPELVEEANQFHLTVVLNDCIGWPEQVDKLLEINQKAPEFLHNYNNETALEIMFENWETLKPLLDSYSELRALSATDEDNVDAQAFFSHSCLQTLQRHPEELSNYVAVFKTFRGSEWGSYIIYELERLMHKPESWPILLEIKEKHPGLIGHDHYLTHYFIQEPKLLPILALAERGKLFPFYDTTLAKLSKHPEQVPAFMEIMWSLPNDFPQDVLGSYLEDMLRNPQFVDRLLHVKKSAPLLFDRYKETEREFFIEHYEELKGLLDCTVPHRELLFNPPTMEFLSHHPNRIPEYEKLLNEFKEHVSPPWAVAAYANVILDNPKLRESIVLISKKSPEIVSHGSATVFQLFLEHHELFTPIVNADQRIQKFLVHGEVFKYLVDHPSDVLASIRLVEQLPEQLPVSLFTQHMDKWLGIAEAKRRDYIEVFIKIDNSPSQEMQRVKDSLLAQIIETENPVAAYEKIESVFIKNNLPTVGKVYKVFSILYPNSEITNKLTDQGSPVLKGATGRRRQSIIYKDLMRVHIRSGNRSLRRYAEVLEEGQSTLEVVDTKGIESLSEEQQRKLKFFLDKLDTLLLHSSLESEANDVIRSQKSLEERYRSLRESLLVRGNQKVTERIAEMFLKPAGFESLGQILHEMKVIKQQTDERNRSLVTRAPEGRLQITPGDLLKGTELGKHDYASSRDMQYIINILQNGSVSGEFLGSSAASDYTPFDTDVSLVLPQAEGEFSAIVKNSIANGHGPLLLCVKDRGQFQRTTGLRKVQPEAGKLELFNTGDTRHYGIRTGFPTTEIDFLIAKKEILEEPRTMERLYLEIAQNGYYIPVTDTEGRVIFSPEMYDEYRKVFRGLERFDGEAFDYKPLQQQDKSFTQVTEIAEKVKQESDVVGVLSAKISEALSKELASSGIHLKDRFDSGIIGAELLDTGSTGRRTNLPGDYDFDLSLKLDTQDFARSNEIANKVRESFKAASSDVYTEGSEYTQLRLKGVTEMQGVSLDKPIDIDIGFSKKSELVVYASHDAVQEKLQWIKENLGPEEYEMAIANILLTKQILKEGKAYKKVGEGGFGGIGTENWILANGGNIEQAFRTFYEAAHENGERISLDKFKGKYKILDPGYNIKFKGHDDYIRNLKPDGYKAMLDVIEKYMA